VSTYEFEIRPVAPIGYEPDPRSRWRRLKDRFLRRKFTPTPIYPAGTRALTLKSADGARLTYFPAVQVIPKPAPLDGWKELGYTNPDGLTIKL